MDKQMPTQEQIQEFWEWCGLEWLEDYQSFYVREGTNKAYMFRGNIDFNSLFRYAVPKVNEQGLRIRLLNQPVGRNTFFCAISGKYLAHEWAEHKDPALALFWALWQVKEEIA